MDNFYDVLIKTQKQKQKQKQNQTQELLDLQKPLDCTNIAKTFKEKFHQTTDIEKLKDLILTFATENEQNTTEIYKFLLEKPELLKSALRFMNQREIDNTKLNLTSYSAVDNGFAFMALGFPAIFSVGTFLFGLGLNTATDISLINGRNFTTNPWGDSLQPFSNTSYEEFILIKLVTSTISSSCIPLCMLTSIIGLNYIQNKQKQPKTIVRKRIQKAIKSIMEQNKEYKNELKRMDKQLKKYGFIKNKSGKIIYSNLEIVINSANNFTEQILNKKEQSFAIE